MNEDITFDSIVRNTLSWSLSRDTRSGHVDFPDLVPGVNFFPQTTQPMFSFVLSLGVVPDFFFNAGLGKFLPNENYESGWGATETTTPWKPVAEGSKAFAIGIGEVKSSPPDGAHSLILTIGIRFGVVYGGGVVEHAVQTGAAKVLAVR